MSSKPREARWDNIKFFLIVLVIVGHIVENFCHDSEIAKGLFMFIYSFHMPGFIFISGLFSNRIVDSEHYRYDKLVPYLVIGALLSFYRDLSIKIFNSNHDMDLFDQNKISWFMFALFAYYTIAWLLRKVQKKRYVIIGSIVIALAVGYVPFIDATLALSRIFVFFPFFYAGYLIDRKKLSEYMNLPQARGNAIISIIAFFLFCIFAADKIYFLRRLITGQNSYSALPMGAKPYSFLLRLGFYIVSFLFMLAFMAAIPSKEMKYVTKMGSKTLAVYFWHLPIIYALFKIPALDSICSENAAVMLLVTTVLTAASVVLFSQKPFTKPMEYLQSWKNYENSYLKFKNLLQKKNA